MKATMTSLNYFSPWNKATPQTGYEDFRSTLPKKTTSKGRCTPCAEKKSFTASPLNINFFLPEHLQRPGNQQYRFSEPFCDPLPKSFLFFDPRVAPEKQMQAAAPSQSASRETSQNSFSAEKVLLGPLVLGAGDLIADLAGKTHGAYNQINWYQGTQDPVGLVGLSVASVFSIVSSACTTYDGYREQRLAKRIGDAWGRALANLKLLRGTVTTTGSILALPARAMTLIALATTSKVITAAASVFSAISGALFSTIGFIYFVINSIKIYLQRNFDQELGAVLNNPASSPKANQITALAFLQGKLHVSDEEKAAIRSDVETNPRYQGVPLEKKEAKIASKIGKLVKKKEEELSRVTSGECVDKIKNAQPSAAAEVVEAVLSQCRKNMFFNALGITFSILGISAMLIGLTCSGGALLFVAAVMSVIVTVGLFALDLYYLVKDFLKSQPGRYDKLCLLISSILGFAVASVAVFFSMNLIAIACASVFGMVWLIINLVCYWRLRQLEKGT